MGTGLAFLNNLGQLVIALGGKSNSQAVFVSLFSVSSCAGRLLLGWVIIHTLFIVYKHYLYTIFINSPSCASHPTLLSSDCRIHLIMIQPPVTHY